MSSRVLFIDGHCVLCNGFAKYVLNHDKKQSISVSTLQGETAQASIPKELIASVDSLIYVKNDKILSKSSAAITVFSDLGGWRRIANLGFVLPKPFRDWVYSGIAKRRYKWFGKNDTCEIPTQENSERILE